MLSTIIMGFLYYFLILFAFFFHFSCNKEEPKKIPPKAVKGVLDLRGSKPNVEGEETFLRLQHSVSNHANPKRPSPLSVEFSLALLCYKKNEKKMQIELESNKGIP